MFNIDIASLRDPATLKSVKTQISKAAAIIGAYEGGAEDATNSEPFQSGLNLLLSTAANCGVYVDGDMHRSMAEAYNLGWDTVRLQRGVNKNAK